MGTHQINSRPRAITEQLDANGDGRLSFDEWAVKTTGKFATADKGRDGALDTAEFATTAVPRKAAKQTNCPPAAPVAADEG